jgi:hypothetical protein
MSRFSACPALRLMIAIVLGAIALASGGAEAAALSTAETRYVTLRAGGMIAKNSCWGIVDQTGTIRNFGRKTGVDVVTLDAAIVAAYALRRNKAHKPNDLIPEVTDRVNSVGDQIATDIATDRTKSCSAWIELLEEVGRQYPSHLIPLPF